MFLVLGLPWRSMRSLVCGPRQCCDGSDISHHVIGWCGVSASPLDFANCPHSECYPWNSGTCLTEPNGTLGPSVFAVREGIWQTVQVLDFVSWMNEWRMNTFTKDCCDQSFTYKLNYKHKSNLEINLNIGAQTSISLWSFSNYYAV